MMKFGFLAWLRNSDVVTGIMYCCLLPVFGALIYRSVVRGYWPALAIVFAGMAAYQWAIRSAFRRTGLSRYDAYVIERDLKRRRAHIDRSMCWAEAHGIPPNGHTEGALFGRPIVVNRCTADSHSLMGDAEFCDCGKASRLDFGLPRQGASH